MKRVQILVSLGILGLLGLVAFNGCGISVKVDLGSDGGGGIIGLDGGDAAGCWQTSKLCSGVCTPKDQVSTGCAGACEPCNVPNATPQCNPGDGMCGIATCNPGFADCDAPGFTSQLTGCEININADILNCGSCGNDCSVIGPKWQCVNGTCCEVDCQPGYLNCNNCGEDTVCETPVSVQNCGSCGALCDFAHATPTCDPAPVAGGYECHFICEPGYTDCDQIAVNGCETNTGSDTLNCGACGNVCDTTNGTPNCNNGNCEIQCVVVGGVLYGDCNGTPGCETPLNSTQNCGSCGNACNPANATGPICTPGGCSYTACQSGYDDCNGNLADGCETPVNTQTNCGSCGQPCPAPGGGSSSCASLTCSQSCNGGFQNCDGNFGNGCESLSSLQHCGACNAPCNPQHANGATCPGGNCSYASCQGGWGDCDSNDDNGCEQTLTTLTHCGNCNQGCNPAHANGPTCSSGSCAYGSCQSGWSNCDSNPANGCESQLGQNNRCANCNDNCTLSGKVCNGTACVCPGSDPIDCGGSCAKVCCTSAQCSGSKCCVNDACINSPDGGC